MRRMKAILPALVVFLLLVTACSGGANEAATQTAESDAATEVARGVEETAEARSQEETQVAEDDAATAEAISEMETQSAIEEATISAAASKTAAAEAVRAASTQRAEAILSDINDVLLDVGHSTDTGQLGWIQSRSDVITIPSGNFRKWLETGGGNAYGNFVIHFNATWDTSGLAGCGLIFRAEEDLLNGQQYIFDTVRFSGLPGWRVILLEFSQFQAIVTGGVKFTNKLDLDNGATNNYVLVADGPTLTVYINGSRISGVTVATRNEGIFAFYAWQTDGSTTCTFEDTWVWELP